MLKKNGNFLLLSLAALVLFLIFENVFVSSFQQCIYGDPTQGGTNYTEYNARIIGAFLSGQVPCSVDLLDAHAGLLAAVSGFIVAFFTYTLWGTSRDQAGFTKASVDHMRTTERAFVFLEDFDVTKSISWPQTGAIFPSITIAPRWKNSGATPTRNLELRVTAREVNGALPENHDYFYLDDPLHVVIGPNANEWSPAITFSNFPTKEAADEELQTIYVWGEARYLDVFEDTPRFTCFCSRMRVYNAGGNDYETQFIPHGEYNRTDYDG